MNPRTRRTALFAIAAIAIAASVNALAHSYAGLYAWALHHRLTGWQAVSWPAEIDVFLAVGELALYVAYLDGWPARQRLWPWTTTLVGLIVSVAGNVGHIQPLPGHPVLPADRLTAAASPLAAFAGLTVGLLVLRMNRQRTGADPEPGAVDHRHQLSAMPEHANGLRPALAPWVAGPVAEAAQDQAQQPMPSAVSDGCADLARSPAASRRCCRTLSSFTERLPLAVSGSPSGTWLAPSGAVATGSPTRTCALSLWRSAWATQPSNYRQMACGHEGTGRHRVAATRRYNPCRLARRGVRRVRGHPPGRPCR